MTAIPFTCVYHTLLSFEFTSRQLMNIHQKSLYLLAQRLSRCSRTSIRPLYVVLSSFDSPEMTELIMIQIFDAHLPFDEATDDLRGEKFLYSRVFYCRM